MSDKEQAEDICFLRNITLSHISRIVRKQEKASSFGKVARARLSSDRSTPRYADEQMALLLAAESLYPWRSACKMP